ncbi:alpha-defensin 1-like [Phyllostomus hastatus]|uniref:alpha-defensin 1-like n=1 Tax=Phyllostomus hastatus TaxID=9423 RepID=UPI001E67EB6E|nr:alpha-defensin 1-like [Phyllostomus hastatus]
MRTLTLLAALLLLAFQAHAETLQETADKVPAQDQPGEDDLDLFGDEDQDVAVSFTGEERFSRQLTGGELGMTIAKAVVTRCRCRRRRRCRRNKVNKVLERASGVCKIFGRRYKLCCK